MSSTVYDITFTLCVTSHNACISDITHSVYDISILFGITQSVMTTQPLCIFTATMSDITPTVSVSSHPSGSILSYRLCVTSQIICVWHHMHYMWHHIHNLGNHTSLCMKSGPLYMTSLPLFLCHHTTLSMILQTLYVWPHIQYICDITSPIFMT